MIDYKAANSVLLGYTMVKDAHGHWQAFDPALDRFLTHEEQEQRGLVAELTQDLAYARGEQQRLRDLCNGIGIERARAGKITRREYEDAYYAPTVRADCKVWEAEQALKAAQEGRTP